VAGCQNHTHKYDPFFWGGGEWTTDDVDAFCDGACEAFLFKFGSRPAHCPALMKLEIIVMAICVAAIVIIMVIICCICSCCHKKKKDVSSSSSSS
jgi:hypothetical protein